MNPITLDNLTSEQRKAVEGDFSKLYISAGPGSGKTRVLTLRVFQKEIKPILDKKSIKINSERIFVITFTKKAANELRSRLNHYIEVYTNNLLKDGLEHQNNFFRYQLFVGTFHSLAFTIIKHFSKFLCPKLQTFSVLDPKDARQIAKWSEGRLLNLVKNSSKKKEYDVTTFNKFDVKDFLNILSIHKQSFRVETDDFDGLHIKYQKEHFELVLKNNRINLREDEPLLTLYLDIYQDYQNSLHKSNQLDFDDLLQYAICFLELIIKDPRLAKDGYDNLRMNLKSIYVDEFQDCNSLQLHFLNLIYAYCKKYKRKLNISVVGDSDQSIFGWRDHKPIYLDSENRSNTIQLIFSDLHSAEEREKLGWSSIRLSHNFRSSDTIIQAATEIINRDQSRSERLISKWTKRQPLLKSVHPKPIIKEFHDSTKEASFIANDINNLKNEAQRCGYPINYNDFAILVRATHIVAPLLQAFNRLGIPYEGIGGKGLWARKEVLDLLAYLKVVRNPCDITSLLRASKTPSRKIGPKAFEALDKVINPEFGLREVINYIYKPKEVKAPENVNVAELNRIKKHAGLKKLIEQFKLIYELVDSDSPPALDNFIKNIIDIVQYPTQSEEGKKLETLDGKEELLYEENHFENTSPLEALIIFSSNIEFNDGILLVEDSNEDNQPGNSLMDAIDSLIQITCLDTTVSTEEDLKDLKGLAKGTVKVATLHSSKGLEWPFVYIMGAESGLIPHYYAERDGRLDEEARLFYVGITRCKYLLRITYCVFRGNKLFAAPRSISPFLQNLPTGLLVQNIKLGLEFWKKLAIFLGVEVNLNLGCEDLIEIEDDENNLPSQMNEIQTFESIVTLGNKAYSQPQWIDNETEHYGFVTASQLRSSQKSSTNEFETNYNGFLPVSELIKRPLSSNSLNKSISLESNKKTKGKQKISNGNDKSRSKDKNRVKNLEFVNFEATENDLNLSGFTSLKSTDNTFEKNSEMNNFIDLTKE